jgi:indolepyruvate ferredoxin oxidoreductase beta subunit
MNIQLLLAGVGGQGILFSAKLFSQLGLNMGLNIIGSETHGMSQRGGSVVAHLKLGDFQSPIIREGTAEILYSFEKNETYKNLVYVKKGGSVFVNLADVKKFDKNILDHLEKKEINFRSLDAGGIAFKLGSVRSANIVLIGFSAGTGLIPFSHDALLDVLRSLSRKPNLEANLKAFEIGYKEGKAF